MAAAVGETAVPPPKIDGLPKAGLDSAAPNSEVVEVVVGVPKIDPAVVAAGAENRPAGGVDAAGLPKIEPVEAGVPNKLGAEVVAVVGDPKIEASVVAGVPNTDGADVVLVAGDPNTEAADVVLVAGVPNMEAAVVAAGVPNMDAAAVVAAGAAPKSAGVLLGVADTAPPNIDAAGLAGATAAVPPKIEGAADVEDNDSVPKSDGAVVSVTAPKSDVDCVVVAAVVTAVVAVVTASGLISGFGNVAPIEPNKLVVVAGATDAVSDSVLVTATVGLVAGADTVAVVAAIVVTTAALVSVVGGVPNNEGTDGFVSDAGAPKIVVAVVLGAPNNEELVTGVPNREELAVVVVPKLMAALEVGANPKSPPVVFGAPNIDGALEATVAVAPNKDGVL